MGQACAPCEQAATGASAKQEVCWGTEFAETVLEKHMEASPCVMWECLQCENVLHGCVYVVMKVFRCTTIVCTNCTAAPIWGGDTPLSARAFSRGTEEEERDGPSKFTDVRMASWHWTVIQVCCTTQDRWVKVENMDDVLNFLLASFALCL